MSIDSEPGGIQSFSFESRAQRVLFGHGTLAQAAGETERMGIGRALVLCTPPQRAQAERVADLLGARAAGIFDGAVMHVPIESARAAREAAARLGADGAVAIGGGSTIGLGKAIALESGLPILAIPTTYAGSEMTPIYGLTEGGQKGTGKDPRVLPRSVIYDPALTVGLPVGLSVVSGINAIAHAAEGLYAVDGNPVCDLMAVEGIAALGRALPGIPDYKFTPMLMLTTESAADKKAEGKAAGATGWLVKPFNPEQLVATVQKVLG